MPVTTRGRRLPVGFWKGATGTKKKAVRRAVARMRPTTKAVIRSIAKKVVADAIEDKQVGGIVEPSVNHDGIITSTDFYPILPPVNPGSGYFQRTGQKIRPKSLVLKVRVALADDITPLDVPYRVTMFILNAKRLKSYNVGLGTLNANALLEGGDGNTYPFDGSTMNALMPVNRDVYTQVRRISFRLSATTAEDHKPETSKEFTIRIPTPKTLMYDQPGGYPENFAPFVAVGWSRDDGITPPPGMNHIRVTSRSVLLYEDA